VSYTTTPFCDWSLTGHCTWITLKPADWRSCCAVAASSPVTSGTLVAGFGLGPADTWSRSREPAVELETTTPTGLLEATYCTTTVPFGCAEGTWTTRAVRPACRSAAIACCSRSPLTSGTATGTAAFATWSTTFDPGFARLPAFGSCETTVPGASCESTCSSVG